jgi:uroporphyrinogen decarboxylase
MWGGVDKRTLTAGRTAIDQELERVKPLIHDGGYIPMLDHSATPDTPYENYGYFLERLKKIL